MIGIRLEKLFHYNIQNIIKKFDSDIGNIINNKNNNK